MSDKILMGIWKYMIGIPPELMKKRLPGRKKKFEAHLGFMTGELRQVHHFVVRELPYAGKPLPPGYIAERLGMPVERVVLFLDELEQHMTFLFRNAQGDVVWAYPVTVEQTPHRITFDTGEQLYAA
ncbi:MAG: hypothetical protein ABFD62_18550 [Syntrophaceae bacterium]